MPLLDLRPARADIHVADVLALLGWTARARRGVPVRGPGPVHGSQSPRSRSCAAHLGKNVWPCVRCGASANALDLCIQATRPELYAAVVELYRRLGRAIPWLSATNTRRTGKRCVILKRTKPGASGSWTS